MSRQGHLLADRYLCIRGTHDGDGRMVLGGLIVEGAGKRLMGGITLPALRQELAELKAAMDDETLPQDERDEAEEEWHRLVRAHSKGGKVGGQAGRAADRVRKAIKAKIDEWREFERTKGKPNRVLQAFSKHLEQCLWLPSMGGRGRAGAYGPAGCFTYVPPEGVVWKD